jgi:hypothetical protein
LISRPTHDAGASFEQPLSVNGKVIDSPML